MLHQNKSTGQQTQNRHQQQFMDIYNFADCIKVKLKKHNFISFYCFLLVLFVFFPLCGVLLSDLTCASGHLLSVCLLYES